MQASAPELIDLSGESKQTLDQYGVTRPEPKKQSFRGGGPNVYRQFGTNCLLARRLVERGVRFVHVAHTGGRGGRWGGGERCFIRSAATCRSQQSQGCNPYEGFHGLNLSAHQAYQSSETGRPAQSLVIYSIDDLACDAVRRREPRLIAV